MLNSAIRRLGVFKWTAGLNLAAPEVAANQNLIAPGHPARRHISSAISPKQYQQRRHSRDRRPRCRLRPCPRAHAEGGQKTRRGSREREREGSNVTSRYPGANSAGSGRDGRVNRQPDDGVNTGPAGSVVVAETRRRQGQ